MQVSDTILRDRVVFVAPHPASGHDISGLTRPRNTERKLKGAELDGASRTVHKVTFHSQYTVFLMTAIDLLSQRSCPIQMIG